MMREYYWDIDPNDASCVVIYNYGKKVMSLYMGEAIQGMGRKLTMDIVRDLDSCHYIKSWQQEKHEEVIDILKK
jgi:hypothetical protein